jgi:nucleotide-binding universal stress UspA family protein
MSRPRPIRFLLCCALLLAFPSGCAEQGPPVLIPPKLDLARYPTIGIVEFDATGPAELGALATREFVSALHDAQPGTPVLELGTASRAFGPAAEATPDPEAIRALAARTQIDAIVLGAIGERKGTPRVALDAGGLAASAHLLGTLDVRVLDARTGATVWSSAVRSEVPVAALGVARIGVPRVDATPVEEARVALVQDLVGQASFDLRPHWVRR